MWVAPRLTPLDIQNKKFSPALRGYGISEVDMFLDELSEQLNWLLQVLANVRFYPQAAWELPERLRQILKVIRRTEFPKAMRGYSIPDVDNFLDEIAYDLQAFLQQIDFAQANATRALPRPGGGTATTTRSGRRLTAREIRGTFFTRVLGGYAGGEVDAFVDQMADVFEALGSHLNELRRAAEQMRSGYYAEGLQELLEFTDLPQVTPTDVESQAFTKAVRGYAMHEVDAFLDALTAALAATQQDIILLRQELFQLLQTRMGQMGQMGPPQW